MEAGARPRDQINSGRNWIGGGEGPTWGTGRNETVEAVQQTSNAEREAAYDTSSPGE